MVDQPVVPTVPVPPADPSSSAPSQSSLPSRGQFVGALGAVATYIVVLAASHFGLTLPDYVQLAIPVIVGFVVAYLVPPTAKQVAMGLNDSIVQLAATLPESQVSARTVVLPQNTKVVSSIQAKAP